MPIALSDDRHGEADGATPALEEAFPALSTFQVPNIPPAAYYIPDFITKDEEELLLRKLAESPQPKWKTVPSGRRLQYWGGNTSKNGTLLPEPLPDWLTTFPDIIRRIDSFLDVASGLDFDGTGKVLGVNQVLVNEYGPGQGISPHEDGAAFRPLVATISLGSHCVLDIHHYLSATSPSPPMVASTTDADGGEGRPIAAVPLAHLLVMPRSLLILSSSLYTSHLHGIAARSSDTVVADPEKWQGEEAVIANRDQLGDSSVLDKLRDEGRWTGERGTRTSMTFRHAEKVLKGGVSALAQKGLHRA